MFVQELIERSMYERLRLRLVAMGLTPDILEMDSMAEYVAALEAIKASKGYSVELFGASSYESRGEKKHSRMVLDWVMFSVGDIGTSPGVNYAKEEDGSFSSFNSDVASYEGVMAIIVLAKSQVEARMLHQALRESLPSLAFIPYHEGNGTFLVIQDGAVKTSSGSDMLQEWVYTYTIPDIFFNIKNVGPNYAAINQIILDTELSSYLGISLSNKSIIE